MPWPEQVKEEKKMPMLKDIVAKLCEKNPELENNQMYLLVEVWSYQGLKLYPAQRELLLSGTISTSNGVSAESRRYRAAKKEAGLKLAKKRAQSAKKYTNGKKK